MCAWLCARVSDGLINLRKAAYYWMESLWGVGGGRTSIRRLAKHHQLIRPVITAGVRKHSQLTPVWKQSDNANIPVKPPCVPCTWRVHADAGLRAWTAGVLTVKREWVGVCGSVGGGTSGGNLLYNSVYYCCGRCLRSTHTIMVHSARLQVASGLN